MEITPDIEPFATPDECLAYAATTEFRERVQIYYRDKGIRMVYFTCKPNGINQEVSV